MSNSIPVNFLNAIPGTPLQHAGRTQALKALKVLALYAANSIFVGDYLTTDGQEVSMDHGMIEDLGFQIELNALEEGME